jgi:hypothetical protein
MPSVGLRRRRRSAPLLASHGRPGGGLPAAGPPEEACGQCKVSFTVYQRITRYAFTSVVDEISGRPGSPWRPWLPWMRPRSGHVVAGRLPLPLTVYVRLLALLLPIECRGCSQDAMCLRCGLGPTGGYATFTDTTMIAAIAAY